MGFGGSVLTLKGTTNMNVCMYGVRAQVAIPFVVGVVARVWPPTRDVNCIC